MFQRFRNKWLYKKAVRRIILPESNDSSTAICSKQNKRNPGIIPKLSLSFVMVIAVICAGSYVIPLLRNFNQDALVGNVLQHNFTLVAYAADISSASSPDSSSDKSEAPIGTTLQPNISIRLLYGKIFGENKVYSSADNSTFICSGKDIDSVTFTASEGNLYYFNPDKTPKIICTIDLTGNESFLKEYAQNTNIDEVFKKLWDRGEFDNYKKRYFDGMSSDLGDYYLISNIIYGEGKPLENKMDIAYKTDAPKTGKSITVKSGEEIHWSPSGEILRLLAADPELDYSELKKDYITVNAKFTNGQTLTKTVVLSFDQAGYLYANLVE